MADGNHLTTPLLSPSEEPSASPLNFPDISLIDEFLFGPNSSRISDDDHHFDIGYLKWRDVVNKKQRRMQSQPKMQRLHPIESMIELRLTFHGQHALRDFHDVLIKVQRQPFEGVHDFYMQPFPLAMLTRDDIAFHGETRSIVVKVNLDSAYIVEGKKVYELAKSKPNERNNFKAIVEVYFRDGTVSREETRPFRVLGKAKPTVSIGGKRSRILEEESSVFETEYESYSDSTTIRPNSTSPDIEPSHIAQLLSPGSFQERIAASASSLVGASARKRRQQFQLLEAREIEANVARIKKLYVGHTIVTSNGDIAYHFRIQESPEGKLEIYLEGEVVGFVSGEDGKIELVKLKPENCNKVFMKGVITRKMFLEAMLPNEAINDRHETVCFSGIVPVRTTGPVRPMDTLYSSETTPGCATTEAYLSPSKVHFEPALIGTCIEEHLDIPPGVVHMPQASVSFHSNAGQILAQRMIKKSIDEQTATTVRQSKRLTILLAVILVILAALSFVLFYQLFQPGSALKKWQCARHHVGDDQQSYFWHDHYDEEKKLLQFTFDVLWSEKLNDKYHRLAHPADRPHLNESEWLFYLNVERCADPGKKSLGPRLVAIDRCCTRMYELNHYYEWQRDCQVCWEPKCNLECRPKFDYVSRRARSNCSRTTVMCPHCHPQPIFIDQLPDISKNFTYDCRKRMRY